MIDWLRRVDPAFYHKEPYLLRTQAQIDRYSDDAQADVRSSVLTADRMMLAATALVALSAYAAATAGGDLDPRTNWLTLWACAVLAVAAPCALPWWPRPDGPASWCQALVGIALIAVSAVWTGAGVAVLIVALSVGATLLVTRGRARAALLVLAAGVLFGARMPAQPLFIAPLAGVLAAAVAVLGVGAIGRVWRRRPQVLTWSAFATLLVVCAYTFALAPAVALHVPVEIAAIAVGYAGVCIVAGRIRRAELMARPPGLLSLPQSIVPLLDRSQDHAVICWIE